MAIPLSAAKMLSALKAEGLTVNEHSGWKTHNRDAATGRTFGPVIGVLIHHTAGHNDRELCFNGRSDLPGPLCHAWLGKTAGLWMIGNGRTNHAGSVDLDVLNALRAERSPLPHDDQANADGNDCLYGLEIENLGNGTDPYPSGQYDQAVRWATALCRAHGWSEKSVAGHKEVQPGKVDPSFDMNVFRAAVAARLAHTPNWNPNEENPMALTSADGDVVVDRLLAGDKFDAPEDATDYDPDPTKSGHYWSGRTVFRDLVTRVRNLTKSTDSLHAKLDALPAVDLTDVQIATLASAVASNPALAEQIAERVAVKLAERLAD
jgi:hypothetical protein